MSDLSDLIERLEEAGYTGRSTPHSSSREMIVITSFLEDNPEAVELLMEFADDNLDSDTVSRDLDLDNEDEDELDFDVI